MMDCIKEMQNGKEPFCKLYRLGFSYVCRGLPQLCVVKMVLVEWNIVVVTSQSFLMPLSPSVSISYVSGFLFLADGSIYKLLKVVGMLLTVTVRG